MDLMRSVMCVMVGVSVWRTAKSVQVLQRQKRTRSRHFQTSQNWQYCNSCKIY